MSHLRYITAGQRPVPTVFNPLDGGLPSKAPVPPLRRAYRGLRRDLQRTDQALQKSRRLGLGSQDVRVRLLNDGNRVSEQLSYVVDRRTGFE